ncbi:hypothetical protein [Streptomyces synnematoformans]|uniref:hypothetical protein n=1 Tax=Streptomyces synnematoformans TaxID=415721 RepID=UPI0031D7D516
MPADSDACRTPSKLRFATREAAENRAARGFLAVGLLYPYGTCPCGWWHLTSTPPPAAADADPEITRLVAALGPKAFADLVHRDIRGRAHPQEAAALRADDVVDRWHAELRRVLAAHDADFERRRGADSEAIRLWRTRATWARQAAARRYSEAKTLRHRAAVRRRNSEDPDVRLEQIRADRASIKDVRARAGEIAVHRLIDAHGKQFAAFLAEECERLGIEVPDRIRRHLTTDHHTQNQEQQP